MKLDSSLKVCGIYSIQNNINGFEYIGSSKLIYKRLGHHLSSLRADRHTNEHLQNSYNKYGETAFEFKILEICSLEKLHEREEYYISITVNKYNFNDKPTGPLKLPTPSQERRLKVSKANTGQKRTEEQLKRFSDSHKGLILSNETKEKQSIARLKYIEINRDIVLKQLSEAGKLGAKKLLEKFKLEHPDGHRVEWITLICLQCKNEFKLQPCMAKIQQYCSKRCGYDSNKGKIPVNKGVSKFSSSLELVCRNCNTQFTSIKKHNKYSTFCSLSCRGKFNSSFNKVGNMSC